MFFFVASLFFLLTSGTAGCFFPRAARRCTTAAADLMVCGLSENRDLHNFLIFKTRALREAYICSAWGGIHADRLRLFFIAGKEVFTGNGSQKVVFEKWGNFFIFEKKYIFFSKSPNSTGGGCTLTDSTPPCTVERFSKNK